MLFMKKDFKCYEIMEYIKRNISLQRQNSLA